jgi:PIN domain
MICAVRDCLVTGYEPLIGGLVLPDPDDRHVLAAAIRARAQVIVTNNLKDFPADRLAQWDIEPKSPDEFISDQIDLDTKMVWGCVQQIADAWRNRPELRTTSCAASNAAGWCARSPNCGAASASGPGLREVDAVLEAPEEE